MNRHLLILVAAVTGVLSMQAHDYTVNYNESPGSQMTITWTDNTKTDMHFLAMPAVSTQPFFTSSSLSTAYESQYPNNKFSLDKVLFEFNFSQKEWLNGDANASKDGYTTSTSLPSGAKITSIALPGKLTAGTAGTVAVTAYLKNASNDMLNADLGYKEAIKRVGLVYADSVPCALGTDGQQPLLSLPLSNGGTPFIYSGTDIVMGLNLDVPSGAASFEYATAKADKNLGTAIHAQSAGKDAFNTSAGEDYGTAGAVATFLNLKRNSVPAAQVTYYTNDVRFKVTDIDGNLIYDTISTQQPNGRPFVRIIDLSDGNKVLGKVEVDENGEAVFSNLDYTHSYNISAASNSYGYLAASNIKFEDAGLSVETDMTVDIKFHLTPGFDPPFGGVENPTVATFKAWGSNGCISVSADTETPVTVCDLAGRVVNRFTADAGTTSVDGLAPGIYVVNRTKVIVK